MANQAGRAEHAANSGVRKDRAQGQAGAGGDCLARASAGFRAGRDFGIAQEYPVSGATQCLTM